MPQEALGRCGMGAMPTLVDYAGRFESLEEACFALVRDHGVGHLSRQQVATTLGTSASTVRRLRSPEADLRLVALSEVRVRRTAGRPHPPEGDGVDTAAGHVLGS